MNPILAKVARFTGGVILLVILSLGVREVVRMVVPVPKLSGPMVVPDKGTSPFYIADAAIGGSLDASHIFTDQDGKTFDLASWYDKPMVISFSFTSCTEVCPMINASLAKIVKDNKDKLGKDFRLVTVGFDTKNDTPAAMHKFGGNFTKDFTNWKFLSGSEATVSALARKLGATYKFESGKGWQHYIGVTVIAPGGKVSSQLFGPEYSNEQFFEKLDVAMGKQPAEPAAQAKAELK